VVARGLRGFADGFVSVLLAGYLSGLGFSPFQVGAIVTGTLVGSAVVTLGVGVLATGRSHRTVLLAASGLMAATGIGFVAAQDFWPVLLVAVAGTLNPTAGDVSVFLPLEQALLADRVDAAGRPRVYARYNLVGSVAGAVGALASVLPDRVSDATGWALTSTQRLGFVVYVLVAAAVALLYRRLPRTPAPAPSASAATTPVDNADAVDAVAPLPRPRRRPRRIVVELAAMFSLDSAGSGLVTTSLVVLWLHLRFDLDTATTGAVFFAAGLLTGLSQLLAAPLARRVGLVRTMSFTHLPANAALAAAAFAPSAPVAIGLLLFRASLQQMDVPARQAFVMAVVPPEERAAAASITNVPRSLASATTPLLAGALLSRSTFGWPLLLAGVAKGVYDVALLRRFGQVPDGLRPPPTPAPASPAEPMEPAAGGRRSPDG
jgi:MFS family permease